MKSFFILNNVLFIVAKFVCDFFYINKLLRGIFSVYI